MSTIVSIIIFLKIVLVLVYTQEGLLGAEYCGVMITQVFLRVMVAPGTRTFMCPPRHKIVKYCLVWGRGGGAKILQKIMAPPLSVIKIVKCCVVGGGGRQNPTKDNGAPSLCH